MSDQSSKSALRKKMKSVIAGLSQSVREEKDNRIAIMLRLFLVDFYNKNLASQNQSILNLGVYSPLSDEVKWEKAFPLSENEEEIKLCYPSFESDGVMVFRGSSIEELEMGRDFGVPIGAPKESSPVEVPEICLIPGLAFSKEGERLGRGKGYYDRYLEHYPGVKVGIAYSEQLEVEIPRDDHDQLLDGVVTDIGFFFQGKLLNL